MLEGQPAVHCQSHEVHVTLLRPILLHPSRPWYTHRLDTIYSVDDTNQAPTAPLVWLHFSSPGPPSAAQLCIILNLLAIAVESTVPCRHCILKLDSENFDTCETAHSSVRQSIVKHGHPWHHPCRPSPSLRVARLWSCSSPRYQIIGDYFCLAAGLLASLFAHLE